MEAGLARYPSHFTIGAESLAPSYHTTQDGSDLSAGPSHSDAESGDEVNPADTDLGPPPQYSPSTSFRPAVFLQIETIGKRLFSFPSPARPDPIPIYGVRADGLVTGTKFVSLRASRGSGSCTLVDGADNSVVRSSTTYRFGPGRDPRVKLLPPPLAAGLDDVIDLDVAEEGEDGQLETPGWDGFEIKGRGLLTRAVAFKTRLGSFEWRYASKKERKAADADSLLVLDLVAKVALAQNLASSSGAKEDEVRTPVAHFVRNAEYRSQGTSRSSAGNGGRLMIDLGAWDESRKVDREMVVVLAVTTCIGMLKKEVDRQRRRQMAVMTAVMSGAI